MMNLSLLHNLSGCTIFLALMAKVALQLWLDYLQTNVFSFRSIVLFPKHYFLPYRNKVDGPCRNLKKVANFLLIVAAVALVVNIVAGLLIYQSQKR